MGFIKKWWSFVRDSQHSGAVVAIFTAVIAVTGIVYTIFSILQWYEMRTSVKIAHAAFLAANKPSVGVSSIGAQHMGIDAAGKPINSPQPSSQTNNFRIAVEVKNFGTVAAENFVPTWRIFLNGVQRNTRPLEQGSRPSTIFPGRVVFLTGIVGAENYHAIMAGEKTLDLEVTVRYDGLDKSYAYCERWRYNPPNNAFLGLGAACTQ